MSLTPQQANQYGTERFGRLRRAMLHAPGEAIRLINDDNREYFLFSRVPDPDLYLEEHRRYQDMLRGLGVEVHLVSEHVRRNTDLLKRLPNLAYLHDIGVVSSHGCILSKMSSRGRCHEEIVVAEALADLGVPVLYEPPEGDAFEGCLLLSPSTVFVADTERHDRRAIERFTGFILDYFDEVIYARIPQERRFMHPDMVLNRVTESLMVYYPPAFLDAWRITRTERRAIDIKEFMRSRSIDLVPLSDDEQRNWGCSFVPLEPGVIINYDVSLKPATVALLEREGVRFHHFHPDALLAGGGSLRCLTMRIWRDDQTVGNR